MVIACGLGGDTVTVKFSCPADSTADASEIESVGLSLSSIVAEAVYCVGWSTAATGTLRSTWKSSSISSIVSVRIDTSTVWDCWPGVNVSVPLVPS